MSFKESRKLLKLQLNRRVNFACQYLEDRGLRFTVDYGYQNAVKLASELETQRWLEILVNEKPK